MFVVCCLYVVPVVGAFALRSFCRLSEDRRCALLVRGNLPIGHVGLTAHVLVAHVAAAFGVVVLHSLLAQLVVHGTILADMLVSLLHGPVVWHCRVSVWWVHVEWWVSGGGF